MSAGDDPRAIGELRQRAAQATGEEVKHKFASWMVEQEKWFGEPDGPQDALKLKRLAERMFATPPGTIVERGTTGPDPSEQFATLDELRARARAAGRGSGGPDGFAAWLVQTEGWFVDLWPGLGRAMDSVELARRLWGAPGYVVVFRDGRTRGFVASEHPVVGRSAATEPSREGASSGRHEGLVGILGGLALLGVLGALVWFFAFADTGNDQAGAIVICEKFVKGGLAFPEEANFSEEAATQTGDETWRVTGIVEAATRVVGEAVRHRYTCEVEYQGDDKWELTEDIQLD